MDGRLASGLGGGLTTPHRKTTARYEKLHRALNLNSLEGSIQRKIDMTFGMSCHKFL
jgi:hypothetical protein